jgi:hypothetical protein
VLFFLLAVLGYNPRRGMIRRTAHYSRLDNSPSSPARGKDYP